MKEKKSNGEDKILKQDMSQTADRPGMIFIIHLLMEKKCESAIGSRHPGRHDQKPRHQGPGWTPPS